MIDSMNRLRLAVASMAFTLIASVACSKALPDEVALEATSGTLTVTGEYRRAHLDSVERMTIDDGKLVLHGTSGTATVDLPPNADPDQKNRGWALVTEGQDDDARTLTFTHETSLDDFTLTLPASDGQIAYGSLGGRDGNDVLVFAYGTAAKTYWGWATIQKRTAAAQ
jgi:hypothetical protein